MLSPDTIRRAVEIADGWEIHTTEFGTEAVVPPFLTPSKSRGEGLKGWARHNLHQGILDALAAQLVRQVDALNFVGIAFDAYGTPFATDIFPDKGESIQADGPDRIANTINAIVQFDKDNPGVLK